MCRNHCSRPCSSRRSLRKVIAGNFDLALNAAQLKLILAMLYERKVSNQHIETILNSAVNSIKTKLTFKVCKNGLQTKSSLDENISSFNFCTEYMLYNIACKPRLK